MRRAFLYILLALLLMSQKSNPEYKIYSAWNKSIDLLAKEKYSEAEAILEKLKYEVLDSSWRSEIYTNLGFIYYKQGKKRKALQLLKQALLLDENNEIARKNYELIMRQLPPPPEEMEEDMETEIPPVVVPKENSGKILEFEHKLPEKDVLEIITRMRKDSSYYFINIGINLGKQNADTPPY